MQSYVPSTAVSVSFPLNEGEALQLRWRVLDEAQAVLQDWQAISVASPAPVSLTLTVTAGLNVLTPPAVRGMRSVELEVTTDSGTQVLTEEYLLQAATTLVVYTNTFLTYNQAVLLSRDFVLTQTAGWNESEKPERESALISAFERILRMPVKSRADVKYQMDGSYDLPVLASGSPVTLNSRFAKALGDLDPTDLPRLEPKMLVALGRAQLLEASSLLSTDPVREARSNGLLSMTVGESSQFFRSVKPIDLPICPAAAEVLSPWIGRFRTIIGRG
jgi:hypothetical protein